MEKIKGKISTLYTSELPSGTAAQVFTIDHAGLEYSYLDNKDTLRVGDEVQFEPYKAVMKNGSEFYRVVAGTLSVLKQAPPKTTQTMLKPMVKPMDKYVAMKAISRLRAGTDIPIDQFMAEFKKAVDGLVE